MARGREHKQIGMTYMTRLLHAMQVIQPLPPLYIYEFITDVMLQNIYLKININVLAI